jgi:amino acid transporter
VSLSTVLGLVNWVNIIVTYCCFQRGLKAQGLARADLPWRGPLQPYGTYITFCITATVIIFQGYTAFIKKFTTAKFIVAYIGLIVYLCNIIVWKLLKRTRRVKASEVDFTTEQRELEQEEVKSVNKNSIFGRVEGLLWGQ